MKMIWLQSDAHNTNLCVSTLTDIIKNKLLKWEFRANSQLYKWKMTKKKNQTYEDELWGLVREYI